MEYILKWIKKIASVILHILVASIGFICLSGLFSFVFLVVRNQEGLIEEFLDGAVVVLLALSALLVGIFARYMVKSYKNAKTSEETLGNAKIILESAETALKKLEETTKGIEDSVVESKKSESLSYNYAEQAQKYALEAKKSAEYSSKQFIASKENADKTQYSYMEALSQIETQKNIIDTLGIHTEIIHARAALFSMDQFGAIPRLYNISRLVRELTVVIDCKIIRELQEELLKLKTALDKFWENAGEISDEGKRQSMFKFVEIYGKDLGEAVKHCKSLLDEIDKSELL